MSDSHYDPKDWDDLIDRQEKIRAEIKTAWSRPGIDDMPEDFVGYVTSRIWEAENKLKTAEEKKNTALVVAVDSIRELERILERKDTYATREIVENLKTALFEGTRETGHRARLTDSGSSGKTPVRFYKCSECHGQRIPEGCPKCDARISQ